MSFISAARYQARWNAEKEDFDINEDVIVSLWFKEAEGYMEPGVGYLGFESEVEAAHAFLKDVEEFPEARVDAVLVERARQLIS